MTPRQPCPPSHRRRGLAAAAALATVFAVTGCQTTPPTPEPPRGRSLPSMPPTPALVVERQWLQSWFDGTPVVITQKGSGPVAVEVPLAFSFDAGKRSVKPPLAAVLDKLAESLRRQPQMTLALAAPGDAGGDTALAAQRAAAVRSYLLGRGAGSAQLGAPQVAGARAVQLRLELR
ncbi:hypothetical protein LOC51_10150 [Rubrivivax sp. JA1024]|uniref:hypothetical protein n=1 Tax=Rubrivivax sp. JA1026 TaxID=2710888 RepID=UPI0013E93C17|nr:hypothetical protein [Rubrivivax sp. JA1026]MCD0417575.1 hypothetical protein [Rubrivivax sp. JA1024]